MKQGLKIKNKNKKIKERETFFSFFLKWITEVEVSFIQEEFNCCWCWYFLKNITLMLLSTKERRKHGGWPVFMGNLWPTRGLSRRIYFTNSSTECLSLGSMLGISTNYSKVLKNWEVVQEDNLKCSYLDMSLMNVDS